MSPVVMSSDVVVDAAAAAAVIVQNAATVTAAVAAARVIAMPAAAAAAAVALVAAVAALVDIDAAAIVAHVDAVMTTVAGAPAFGVNARCDIHFSSGIDGCKRYRDDEKSTYTSTTAPPTSRVILLVVVVVVVVVTVQRCFYRTVPPTAMIAENEPISPQNTRLQYTCKKPVGARGGATVSETTAYYCIGYRVRGTICIYRAERRERAPRRWPFFAAAGRSI